MAGQSAWWEDLPEDLREEILSWLPVEYLCRFRLVSKQWNALVSSTKFITGLWAGQPPPKGKQPWLLLHNLNESARPCAAFCFSTQTWKTFISLSFIGKREELYCRGSASGLLLMEINRSGVYRVCNPLTQKAFQLPPRKSIRLGAVTGIMAYRQGGNGEYYKVIAVGHGNPPENYIVEIYDSRDKIWKMVGLLPDDIQVWTMPDGIVFSNDGSFFYCEGGNRAGWGVLRFSILDGTSIFVSFPEYNAMTKFSKLFTCRSQVLTLAGIIKQNQQGIDDDFSDVIMLEFQKDGDSNSSWWKETVRMPSSLVRDIYRVIGRHDWLFCSVGMGDYVCLRSQFRANWEVLVYNFALNSWSWLSTTCPLEKLRPYIGYSTTIYEPRPDMKVV